MGANLEITEKLQNYINDFGLSLNPVQQEIINYNNTLGDIKRMQVDPSQCYFLHLIIKISNIKNVLEIGTFTGLSALSISLALPNDGKLIALDKNKETNKVAINFFKKANQDHHAFPALAVFAHMVRAVRGRRRGDRHGHRRAISPLGPSLGGSPEAENRKLSQARRN